MDTKAIEKFSIEAREQLLKDVEQRLYTYGLDDAGRGEFGPDSDVVRETVLTAGEKAQRAQLYRRVEDEGADAFAGEMAYTWFNRLAALRYMELHDFLPNHVRVFSNTDGEFEPECLRTAATLELPGLERAEVARLIQAGDDEALYRAILVAQCNELASSLPTVFGTVAADALMLPANLLRKSEFNVLYRLVTDIPEGAWQDVEILGWMYQFYNSEVKATFFKSKRKASETDLAPATQLFTPEWIVRYMVDNSLGRLWMLNHPESRLRDRAHAEDPRERLMEYYSEPDEEHEVFIRVASPEEITFCDPACGSGHILVYAFRMLMAIYEECGYREREIPELILTKNLSGFEIDPRAAQIATLTLALCAREHDRRFFGRGITADITVLQDVRIDADELLIASPLREKQELLESLAHLGEIGSLLQPTADDIAALETDLVDAEGDNLFVSHANAGVEQALTVCRALSRHFDVVVANPPYMGSSSFNPFMSKWVKRRYPDSCKDLCTAFIERGLAMLERDGYLSMITASSWMFISSFERFRLKLIDHNRIASMIQQSTHGFPFVTVPTTMFTIQKDAHLSTGSYIRLEDYDRPQWQQPRALEAIQNPDCGYFYRADATTFHDIPGSPIAYWASDAILSAFRRGKRIGDFCRMPYGFKTGDNERFLRLWWECSLRHENMHSKSDNDVLATHAKWVPYNKGGSFRKWYGNNEYVLNYENCGQEVLNNAKNDGRSAADYDHSLFFTELISWSRISSGKLALRFSFAGSISDMTGPSIFAPKKTLTHLQAFLNSSVSTAISELLSATLDFQPGQIATYPIIESASDARRHVETIVRSLICISKVDWDTQETSWDFKQHPLV